MEAEQEWDWQDGGGRRRRGSLGYAAELKRSMKEKGRPAVVKGFLLNGFHRRGFYNGV